MSYPKRAIKGQTAKTDHRKDMKADTEAGTHKREQVKSLLIGKFRAKYASEAKTPGFEMLITSEVTKFVAQSMLTEANLKKLDAQIASVLKVDKKGASPEKQKSVTDKSESAKGKMEKAQAQATPEKSVSLTGSIAEDVWAVIVDYNKKLHDEEKADKMNKQKETKQKMKQELDKQVEEKKKRQMDEMKQEHQLEEHQVKLESDLEKKDKLKDVKIKEVALKQKMESQKIYESKEKCVIFIEDKAKKQGEVVKEKMAEKETILKIQEELDKDFRKTKIKKEGSKAMAKEMVEALQEVKKRQEELKKREQFEEEKSAIEQKQFDEREQKLKEEALKKKEEQLKVLEHAYEKTAKVIAGNDPKSVLISQKDVCSLPIEGKSNTQVEKMKKETVNILKKQMNEKKVKEEEEKKDKVVYKQKCLKETQEIEKNEKEKSENMKKARLENKQMIESQIDERKKKPKVELGKEEYLVNKQLLEKAISSLASPPASKAK